MVIFRTTKYDRFETAIIRLNSLTNRKNTKMGNILINVKNETGGFEFIGSRGAGEVIREKMKPVLDQKGEVTLDFAGVDQVTQSFIDEFFGIFIRAFGIEYIRGKVKLVNETQGIKDTINFVIKYSKERQSA